jgi:anthranilate phosphoribosyltransferase
MLLATQDLSWPRLLTALVQRRDLDRAQTAWAMHEVLSGAATPAQIAGFAVALRAKGETAEEVIGLVASMYEHAVPLSVPGRALDIVGTGGDRSSTVNISSMAAVVAAAAGCLVVKHGNRAASSSTGAADVLEELGVRLDLPAERIGVVAERVGLTFCFAPVFHSSLRHAAVPRRELGIATTFNFLGPLANPARPQAQAVGVADPAMAPVMASVLAERGVDALVFRGDDGLDELTTTTTSSVWVVSDGQVSPETLDPVALGLPAARPDDLRGGDARENAAAFRSVLEGSSGAVRDAVLLNAAAGIAAHAAAGGPLAERLSSGLERARQAIDSGAAADLLQRWVAVTVELAD